MKKSTLKALIQAVLTECKTCGCGYSGAHVEKENWVAKGSEENFTPAQQATIAKATAKGFKLVSTRPEGNQVVAVLAMRVGGSPVEIEVFSDGSIKKIVGEQSATGAVAGYSTPFAFKKTKKEGMTTRGELDTGMMKAVNVEDEEVVNEMTTTGAVAGYSTPFAFSKKSTGSSRAMDVTKKMGYKPTGIEKKRNH